MAGWVISTSTSQGDAVACSLKTRDLNCNQSNSLISLMEHTPLQQNRYSTIEILGAEMLVAKCKRYVCQPKCMEERVICLESHAERVIHLLTKKKDFVSLVHTTTVLVLLQKQRTVNKDIHKTSQPLQKFTKQRIGLALCLASLKVPHSWSHQTKHFPWQAPHASS
jgi:hypothetical protein